MDSSSSPDSFPTSPNAIFLPICAALVIAANYVPLLLLLRVKKVAACTLVLVLVVGNVFTLINAILWPNDNTDGWYDGVGLCDVQVVLKVPLATLLATCSAYISLDLARALDTDNPRLHETARTKRRRLAFELVFCFAVPILQAPLHYLVQANRFGVITVYGCADIVDDSWPAIVMLAIWPLLFGILNCYFAVLVMHRLRKHRGVLSDTLSSTGSGLNVRRFLKLFFLSASILVVYFPVTIYFFYLNVDYPFTSYSWSRVHDPETWNEISFITTDMDPLIQFDGWVGIVMGCFLFILYGMNTEGKEIYRSWLLRCGFGRIFPRLLHSTELPMTGTDRLSRGSSTSRFDVVSWVARYYERTKKERQSPTSVMTASRMNSGATKEQMGYIRQMNSPCGKSINTSTTVDLEFSTSSSSSSRAVMTPAPMTHQRELNHQTHQAPLFTFPFRTHTNLPYLTSSRTSHSAPVNPINVQTSYHTTTLTNPARVVETTIWSDADTDDDLDPLAPRMGTRAYRERERRLHQQQNSSLGILPDIVTVDFGAAGGFQGPGGANSSV